MNRIQTLGCLLSLIAVSGGDRLLARDGLLTVEARDEKTDAPVITRFELWRGEPVGRPLAIRRTVPVGPAVGVVLDRAVDLSLKEQVYSFRAIRGPEYRVLRGTFQLAETSEDAHTIRLPRMVNLREGGWTSGDCLVPASSSSLPLRMAAEDLHFAATPGPQTYKPIAGRKASDPIGHDPIWIDDTVELVDGLVFYGAPAPAEHLTLPVQRLAAIDRDNPSVRVAIEHPFAWAMPVWLASERISGFFVLGDWLRLDRSVRTVDDGRPPEAARGSDDRAIGYAAERVYWQLLEAGFRLAPLAGSGSSASQTPVGYNRLYVAASAEHDSAEGAPYDARPVESVEQWWRAAWQGQSVATNGPLLRAAINGQLPGHIFRSESGESLELQLELTLTVRDPVEYLEVIHNGRVHYSAKLDEFAKAGGRIPRLVTDRSGWVLVQVVTEYPDHFRAAISAPWYIEFDQQRRVTSDSVDFFQGWLADYETRLKRLPADELQQHVPYVRAARAFWDEKAEQVLPP